VAFKLYDTFGFPFDLIEVIGAEQRLTVDEKGFSQLMDKQRSLSTFHKGGKAHVEKLTKSLDGKKAETAFLGYEATTGEGRVLLLADATGSEVPTLATGQEGFLIADRTPFYAESGGQVGDKGEISSPGGKASVEDTFKIHKAFVHHVKVTKGAIKAGETLSLVVNEALRRRTMINHTATHMLHAALRKVLGDRVKQAGSLVDSQRFRFDFTFPRAISGDERTEIERLVNEEVRRGSRVVKAEMTYDEAIKQGALAFFDEKYGDRVRVIRVEGEGAPFSVELCGGTHLDEIGQIGFFKILSESSVASGVRRIEGITATEAMRYLTEREGLLRQIEGKLNTSGELALPKIEALAKRVTELEKENEKLKVKAVMGATTAGSGGPSLHDRAEMIGSLRVVTEHAAEASPKLLRTLVDQVRDKLKDNGIVALATVADGKAALCVGLTKDLVGRFDASKLIQPLAKELGGTGGGKADFAQAGGSDPAGIPRAFETLKVWLKANATGQA
jgi:alanyl-tRNA synthetase